MGYQKLQLHQIIMIHTWGSRVLKEVRVRSQHQGLGQVGLFKLQPLSGNDAYPKNHLLGGPAWVRGSGPRPGVGPQNTACVSCAGCWASTYFYLPQSWYAWSLHIYSLSNLKLDQLTSRATSSLGQGIKRVEGPCWYLRDPWLWNACGMSVWMMHVCSEHQVGTAAKGGSHEWVRGPGCGQKCQVDRQALPVLEGTMHVHVLVNLNYAVCVLH